MKEIETRRRGKSLWIPIVWGAAACVICAIPACPDVSGSILATWDLNRGLGGLSGGGRLANEADTARARGYAVIRLHFGRMEEAEFNAKAQRRN